MNSYNVTDYLILELAIDKKMKKNKLLKRFPQLSLLSFVAACSAEEIGFAKGFGSGVNGNSPSPSSKFEAEKLASLIAVTNGPTTSATNTGSGDLTVTTTVGTVASTLTFTEGTDDSSNSRGIYQLTSTADQYDLVIASPTFTKSSATANAGKEGKIFIFWNVVGIQSETIGNGVSATNPRLEIRGAAADDQIGIKTPKFFELGGNNDYSMVIRSEHVDRSFTDTGAIYILWDVPNYSSITNPEIILLGSNATNGSLSIYGATQDDQIGIHAPDFLHLDGDTKYDMVIRSQYVDKDNVSNVGAIYILWDVADYAAGTDKNKTIDLGNLADNTVGATAGSLAIYGGLTNDEIGNNDPKFLQLGGKDGYDMVIDASYYSSSSSKKNNGAVFILWDIADYALQKQNETIDLSNAFDQIDSGALAIYGGSKNDQIGNKVSEFLQIGGKDGQKGYDMVIRADLADKDAAGATANEGAIYILWDVADYYSTRTDKTLGINLDNPAEATHGLLTIYGKNNAQLGGQGKDILYNNDGELINIDNDAADTIDIVFNDGDYTYILFGDKITTDGSDAGTNIDPKTIDLGTIDTLLTPATAGFFAYDAVTTAVIASVSATDRIGYRFASEYTDLGNVETAFKSVPLSDADSDLGVWDIA